MKKDKNVIPTKTVVKTYTDIDVINAQEEISYLTPDKIADEPMIMYRQLLFLD